jgi:hypothetical protein
MSEDEIDREFRRAVAGTPYQPSNGTEGEYFFDDWCRKCERDKDMNGTKDDCGPDDWCPIIAASMAYKVGDAKYPPEWRYDAEGYPECTAFVPVGEPIPIQRCDKTPDMFAAPPAGE